MGKKRILTGIQSSGIPHMGNIMGCILPTLSLLKEEETAFLFIADLHTLTSRKDPEENKLNTQYAVAAWLACGLDPKHHLLYRQSRIPEVCELTWYLNCVTPYPMLANAHAFKSKSDRLSDINVGLFDYPVLMAADILLYHGTHIPVGKDQIQHIEMARDMAQAFNQSYRPIFTYPEAVMSEIATLLGIDGQKMSKSYKNTLHLFAEEKNLRKRIMKIQTDSLPIEAPKDPAHCTIFQLYQAVASPEATEELKSAYVHGGLGYGEAKQRLFETILQRFASERELFRAYIEDPDQLDQICQEGEAAAREVAHNTLQEVRRCLGFTS